MAIGMAALALAVLGNLVDADLVVPGGDGEEVGAVGRGRERKGGDGIGGRITEGDVRLKVANGARRGRRSASKYTRHCDCRFFKISTTSSRRIFRSSVMVARAQTRIAVFFAVGARSRECVPQARNNIRLKDDSCKCIRRVERVFVVYVATQWLFYKLFAKII